MASNDELIDPILMIAKGGTRPPESRVRRYSELELRRRISLAQGRINALVGALLAENRFRAGELLKEHAEVLPDGRVAIDLDGFRLVLDQVSQGVAPAVVEVVLSMMFESDAEEEDELPSREAS